MALIDCPECKNPVSTDALACPHCGYESREVIAVQAHQQGRASTVDIYPGITEKQFVVGADSTATQQYLITAISRLGSVIDTGQGFVDGKVKYGLDKPKVRLTYGEADQGTSVTVQLPRKYASSKHGRTIIDNIKETVSNVNNPAFEPERAGPSPASLAGSILLIVVVSVVVASFVGYAIGGGF